MRKPRVLTPQEVRTVLDYAQNVEKDFRIRFFVFLGFYSGLRVSEILSMRFKDVWQKGRPVSILRVRRLKKRTTVLSDIPVSSKLEKEIRIYIESFGDIPDPLLPLFPSRDKQKRSGYLSVPITRRGASHLLEKLADNCGIERFSPHSMRSTLMTTMHERGEKLMTIREFTGHSSLSSLHHYLQVSSSTKRSAVESVYD